MKGKIEFEANCNLCHCPILIFFLNKNISLYIWKKYSILFHIVTGSTISKKYWTWMWNCGVPKCNHFERSGLTNPHYFRPSNAPNILFCRKLRTNLRRIWIGCKCCKYVDFLLKFQKKSKVTILSFSVFFFLSSIEYHAIGYLVSFNYLLIPK